MFLNVEIAQTPYELEKGLMFRTYLEDDSGMLFLFKQSKVLNFWGSNTFIPLDIAFIDKNDIIIKIAHIDKLSLKNVSSDIKCVAAIEANYGYFGKNKIEEGYLIKLDKHGIISFEKPSVKKQAQSDFPNYGNNTQIPPDFPNQTNNSLSGIPTLSKEDLEKYLADNEDANNKLPLEQQKEQEQIEEERPEDQKSETLIPEFSNIFDALNWAEENKKVVRIEYRTLSGRDIIRDVEPHGSFYASTTKRMILVTYDETVGDIRSFIIKQINRYQVKNIGFQVKFNFFG